MAQGLIRAASAILLCLYCGTAFGQGNGSPLQLSFDFRQGALGWQAGFADYPPDHNTNDLFELRAEIRPLPSNIGTGTGFFFQGHNRSDDLFMFIKRRLTSTEGITAGQRYQVYYNLVFASNACTDCVGVGGHPGASVYLKAGAVPIEPIPYGFNQRMNVDIGSQSQGGIATSVTGNIANGLSYDPLRPYVSLQRTHQHTREVTATANGEIWLLVGTDSGFEGLTQLFYQRIDVTLVPVGSLPSTPGPTPRLLAEETTGQPIALNALTHTLGPFAPFTRPNFSFDERTRVTLFATDLELLSGEDASTVSCQIEDAQQRLLQVPIEFVGKVPNFDWLTQIIIRLPPPLLTEGTKISISLRGATSNKVSINYNLDN